jgi:hypothetical protein
MSVPNGQPQVRDDWRARTEAMLLPREQVVDRNLAITAAYARYWQADPELFKWAGAAAFASGRIGLLLAPFEPVVDPLGILSVRVPVPEWVRADLDVTSGLGRGPGARLGGHGPLHRWTKRGRRR